MFLSATDVYGMALFRSIGNSDQPDTPTQPEPTPDEPQPPTEPEPQPLPTDPLPFDVFNDVALPVGDHVDLYYSNFQQLLINRDEVSIHEVDQCEDKLSGQNSFADRIAYYVFKHTKLTKPHLAQLAPYYNVPNNLNQHIDISLTSHKLCPVSKSSLTSTIGSSRVPNSSTIDLMRQFSEKHNRLRERSLDQDAEADIELNKLWTRFMSCLSYTESLTTADSSSSRNVAEKYAPSNYRKPAGVKFYEDPYQNPASRLNIGLFQFTPNARGNVNACIRHWNEQNTSCQISTGSSQSEMIKVFGSSSQTFNAFCGVNKILQTFAIQANTSASRSTHPQNTSGRKPASERCVTPFFYSSWAYNHFGPLMNSTGSNLGKLMSCVMK